ncbi:hypothetical protein BKA70DRAFT_1448527 [Coprinopsis sp. MPI-PUGE-AT-0042]|nr:hypothetical protein BKA70DRAFT_1448527 [Coprinopsis sp. MPI-PUGE-AT-0042]
MPAKIKLTLPARNERRAPVWDEEPETLAQFFVEVEELMVECDVEAAEYIKSCLRYVPTQEIRYWKNIQKGLPEGKENDWEEFKKQVFEIYPGSGAESYTVADINKLAESTAKRRMTTLAEFMDYYKRFTLVADALVESGMIGKVDQSERLLRGLPAGLRALVEEQLLRQDAEHIPGNPVEESEIRKAVTTVLKRNVAIAALSETVGSSTKDARSSSVTKQVFDGSALTPESLVNSFASIMSAAVEKITAMHQPAPGSSGPGVSPGYGFGSRPQTCSFCNDPAHFIRACPHMKSYLDRGIIKRDNEGKLTLPNGDRITPQTAPGRNLKERIENWQKSNSVTSNFYHVAGYQKKSFDVKDSVSSYTHARIEEVSDDEDDMGYGVSVSDIPMLEQFAHETTKKLEAARKLEAENKKKSMQKEGKKGNEHPQKPVAPKKADEKKGKPKHTELPKLDDGAAYRIRTRIEDTAVSGELKDKILGTEISVSIGDILATAHGVRKDLNDDLRPRKVAANEVNKFETHYFNASGSESEEEGEGGQHDNGWDSDDGNIAIHCSQHNKLNHGCESGELPPLPRSDFISSRHSEPLRTVDATILDKLQVKGTMDNGSQVITMHARVWKELGVGRRSDHIMHMESANGSHNDTLGVIPHLKVNIGGIDFYLQVQVVEDASFDLLLGRPFTVLARAVTKDHADGGQDITLTDPHTGARVTIPTRAKRAGLDKLIKLDF